MAKYDIPTIEKMIDAGVHFGHKIKKWHPNMEPYIYTVMKDIHIIDLEKTEDLLKRSCDFLYEQAKAGKTIVFVGTKKQSKEIIKKEAEQCGALYVNERWIGGTITNIVTIRKNLDKLINLIKGREEGEFQKYTKKERLIIDREIEKLQQTYGGIVSMKKEPDVLFIIDSKREKTAVREAVISNIPVVALIDTNADPKKVDYPIPGNDDAIKSVALIVRSVASAVEAGYKDFDKEKDKPASDKSTADGEKPEKKEKKTKSRSGSKKE